MTYIIFTESDKERLKGRYGTHSRLSPLPLANGTEWAVGIEVLTDPEYTVIHSDISVLEQRELEPEDFL